MSICWKRTRGTRCPSQLSPFVGAFTWRYLLFVTGIGLSVSACRDRLDSGAPRKHYGEPTADPSAEHRAPHPVLPPDAVPARLVRIELPVEASVTTRALRFVGVVRTESDARPLWERIAGADTPL